MKNIMVVYWSGTGNTQKMAMAVAEGAKAEGAAVTVKSVSELTAAEAAGAEALALGCPSMGSEMLEEDEMDPFVQTLEKENIQGKPMVLFGSYDWGEGQWMEDWADRMTKAGVKLAAAGLTVQNTPDGDGLALCMELGKKLALA